MTYRLPENYRGRVRFGIILYVGIAIIIGFIGWAYLPGSEVQNLPLTFITNSEILSIIFSIALFVISIAVLIYAIHLWFKLDMGNIKKDYE